jgi:hypothetical protein
MLRSYLYILLKMRISINPPSTLLRHETVGFEDVPPPRLENIVNITDSPLEFNVLPRVKGNANVGLKLPNMSLHSKATVGDRMLVGGASRGTGHPPYYRY